MESPRIHQTITLLYGAFLASSFVYVMVAVFLQTTGWQPRFPQLKFSLLAGLLLLAAGSAGLVVKQKRALFSSLRPAVEGDFRQFVMSRCVLWFALSEIPAILGFVFFILTGSLPGMLGLVAVSAVSFTLARPSLSQLEALENDRQNFESL
jgi:hypothetical protein